MDFVYLYSQYAVDRGAVVHFDFVLFDADAVRAGVDVNEAVLSAQPHGRLRLVHQQRLFGCGATLRNWLPGTDAVVHLVVLGRRRRTANNVSLCPSANSNITKNPGC
jgi:hypothetical protein